MFSRIALLPAFLPVALACLGYEGGVPTPTAHYSNSAVIEIAAGEVFDAGWAKYDRGSGACGGQTEGDWKDDVFYLHSGATLKNVIIGADQSEGVHCDGACTLEFVWFEDVCEDAISIVRPKSTTRLTSPLTIHPEKRQRRRRNLDHRRWSLSRRRQGRPAQRLRYCEPSASATCMSRVPLPVMVVRLLASTRALETLLLWSMSALMRIILVFCMTDVRVIGLLLGELQ
ncbi:unnamed protein product [Aspergillus oryzae RIB40]|uniref:Pectate lyase n=1 Tax=Aspergillus oryzae (strain ATCC 42149 / RIB 40) TaxID=510516 RepID=Q2U2C9_ASPOR|nr:unnamed protein product [Aspergillus oryzae RIB40]BAE64286.1 unnamed protein product [Aspergillus oryzae RIB40]